MIWIYEIELNLRLHSKYVSFAVNLNYYFVVISQINILDFIDPSYSNLQFEDFYFLASFIEDKKEMKNSLKILFFAGCY